MTYAFGKTSLKRLEGVHPKLVQCAKLAISRSSIDFSVVAGVRTRREQEYLYAMGRTTEELLRAGVTSVEGKPNAKKVTWTLQTLHMPQESGYGHAVDLAPFSGGKIVWEPERLFDQIAGVMLSAARELEIPLEWGGHWAPQKRDKPHFQLPRSYK